MKNLTNKERRLKKARTWLNKNCPLGWDLKWTDNNEEVQSLSRILK